jgi:Arc/MetJ family transcription regulator
MLSLTYQNQVVVCRKQATTTTLNIDDDLLKFVREETRASTQTEAIRKALEDYVKRRKVERIIAMGGKVKFDTDTKTLRQGWTRHYGHAR